MKREIKLSIEGIGSFEGVWTPSNTPTPPDPPKPPTPPTPPSDEFIDITDLYYETLANGNGNLQLDRGKKYRVNTIQTIDVNRDISIKAVGEGERPLLVIGKENYVMYVDEGEDGFLFNLNNGTVVIEGVDICLPPQLPNVARYSPSFFTSKQDSKARWTALVKDCNTLRYGKNGGLGMGTTYGGESENHLAFINVQHGGSNLMQAKNSYPESVMYITTDRVTTDYKEEDNWQDMAQLTKGIVQSKDNRLILTGDKPISCIYNHFFNVDVGSNRSTILNIGRFTFIINALPTVINDYTVQLRPAPKAGESVIIRKGRAFFVDREGQAGDTFKINGQNFFINKKHKSENDEWTNDFGKGNNQDIVFTPICFTEETLPSDGFYTIEEYTSSFDLYDQDQPIYLVYKADMFAISTVDSEFGDWQMLKSRRDHICYNHDTISLWAKDTKIEGYYRQSQHGKGFTLGYNMINCSGFSSEFNPPVEITTDKPMPKRISDLL